jgi:NAD(P)-dependent dehydrogenase (short-subunit alcohol dehydrogenase family)
LALHVKVDISDPESVASLHERAIRTFGHVDVVVNNACVFYTKPLLDHSVEEWDRVMAVNLRGAFLTAVYFLPEMVARHHGVFVTMESGEGMPYMAPYFASKAALGSLAGSLGQELGPDAGVSVFCFGAGMVDTPAIREAIPRLAPLYGMTEEQFVKQAAPGGSMLTAEECGAGLVGCILNAARFHGEETAAPAGLALLGLGARTSPAGGEPARSAAHTGGEPREGARETAQLIGELRSEYDSLGMFQRQWYRRMLKQRTGLSLEDWESASQDLAKLADDPAANAQAIAAHAADIKLRQATSRSWRRRPGGT